MADRITTIVAIDAQIDHWRVLSAVPLSRCGAVHEVSVAALEDGSSNSCGCSPPTLIGHRARPL
jgi:hypothetical protein